MKQQFQFMPPPFTPDSRNVGGRNMITQQIWNHLQQLQQIHQQTPHVTLSPTPTPHSPKPSSLEPIYRLPKKKQDYLLFPTFLFRRKTVSENLTPSLSPKPRHDETHLLFQDPYNNIRKFTQNKKNQKIFPYSTVHLGLLQKVKANDVKLQRNQESILWNDIQQQVSLLNPFDIDNMLLSLESIILENGIYSTQDYGRLILLILQDHPQIPKTDLATILNLLIIKQI
ncbi:hypothetical protein pb186bvf_014557 [Paramecium bursaria]